MWTHLHFAWAMGWAVLFTPLCAIGQMIGHQLDPTDRNFKRWGRFWSGMIMAMGGFKLKVHQDAPLDPAQPYVFVSNHQNSLDILSHLAGVPHPFGFLAKASLEKIPFMGWAMNQSVSIWVDRSTPRKAITSMKLAGGQIRKGTSVLIYPEGERTWAHEMVPFMKGAFHLAVEAEVPIVPIVLHDAYALYDERRYISKPGTIHMTVCAPIDMTGKTRKDIEVLMEEVRALMQAELDAGPRA